jgi:hypothetical protein
MGGADKMLRCPWYRTVLGNQTNVEQILEVAEQRNLVA